MGKIINTKRDKDGILLEVKVGYDEATVLQGHYDDIHLFTQRVEGFKSHISTRGRNSSTKYFLVPKRMRKNIDFRSNVKAQKIETEDKMIFVYVVEKKNRGGLWKEQ